MKYITFFVQDRSLTINLKDHPALLKLFSKETVEIKDLIECLNEEK